MFTNLHFYSIIKNNPYDKCDISPMEQKEAKINQLVISVNNNPRSVTHVFNSQPTKIITDKFGKIFGFIEIEPYHPSAQRLAEFIAEEIENAYYRENSSLLEEFSLISEYFEATLKKINMSIASFIESEHVKVDIDKINAIVALAYQNEVHFSYVGKVGALFFYNINKDSYRIINILDSTKSPQLKADPLKMFSHITSGALRTRDTMAICTTNFFDYFSLERLKNIILNPTPAQGLLTLKEMLADIGGQEQFGILTLEIQKLAVAVKKEYVPNEPIIEPPKVTTKDSVHEMVKTEKETEKLLTPSIIPEVKKWAQNISGLLTSYGQKLKLLKPKNQLYKDYKVIKTPRHSGSILNSGHKKKFLNSISFAIPFADKFGKYFTFTKNIKLPKINFGKNFLPQVPQKTKITIVVIVLLIAAFGLSIVGQKISQNKQAKLASIQEAISQAKVMKEEAQASLIYRDENLAKQTLNQAKNLLNSVETKDKKLTEEINKLNQEINDQLYALGNWVDVNPTKLADLQELTENADASKTLINTSLKVYIHNKNSSLLAQINTENKESSRLEGAINLGELKTSVAINNNEALLINQENKAFRLNAQNNSFQEIAFTPPQDEIKDIAIFNNRLYTVTNNQIYRHNSIGQNFGAGTSWIADPNFSINNASGLTIDGFIYILSTDGKITKMLNGRLSEFNQEAVDPAIKDAKKLKTYDNSNFLYFLDAPEKRLIVLDKEGNLIKQYTSSSFDSLKDFGVNEQRKEIFVINGNSVFFFSAQHL
jgi:hypothetical protein